MASAAKLIEALAKEIGWSTPAVEAYALELRRVGWWPPTKRGRGATSITVNDAAKLLLSVLSDGPKSLAQSENDPLAKFDGTGFFLRSANLGYMPADWNNGIFKALCTELGLSDKALFLDFITAFLALFIEGRANHIVRSVFKPTYSDWDYLGPDVIFAVSGPFPMGEIQFPMYADPHFRSYTKAALTHNCGGDTLEKIRLTYGLYMQTFFCDESGLFFSMLEM